jgi:predicted Zn-dependent peptidase
MRVLVVDKPGAAQTVVRFVTPGVGFRSQDRIALQVLNTLLGGSFTSRLNSDLREDKGWTYGAWSTFGFWDGRGVFVADANVQTDHTGDSVREFLSQFARIRAGGVTQGEAARARASLTAETVQRFESLSRAAGAFIPYARYGLPPGELAADMGRIPACVPAALDALAKEHVALPGGVLVLVGDAKAVRAQWQKIDLPPPQVVSRADALAGRLPH